LEYSSLKLEPASAFGGYSVRLLADEPNELLPMYRDSTPQCGCRVIKKYFTTIFHLSNPGASIIDTKFIVFGMFYVYVIYSKRFRKTYVGMTHNLEGRLTAHNHPGNKGYTRHFKPWSILFYKSYQTKSEALKRERFYKSGIGRQIIHDYIKEKK